MSITYVSSFLCGDHPKRSYEAYKVYFDQLASTGVPIVVFLDRRLTWTFPANVLVCPASLEDTWVGQNVPDTCMIPPYRDAVDTLEYMKIISTKFEWVRRAVDLNPWKTSWFAWIDFGLAHVFRTPDATLARLKALRPPLTRGLRTAGIWSHPTSDVWSRVCWRFAGGFFLGDAESLRRAEAAFHETIAAELPAFAWEVNLWALMESRGFDFGWYPCDHDDTILYTSTASTPSSEELER